MGSIVDPFPQRYDLIISIEVLEHMPKDQAELAIKNFCSYTDDILFSSTPFDYKEITHINVQKPEYWAEQFARYGFFRDVDFDATFVTPWAVRFRRSKEPIHMIVRNYERSFALLLKEATDLRSLNYDMRLEISKDEDLIKDLKNQIKNLEDQTKNLEDLSKDLNSKNQGLTNQLSQMLACRNWRFLTRLQQFRSQIAPPESRRARIITRFLNLMK